MIRKPVFIVVAFIIAALCISLFFYYRVPPGVVPKSDSAETIAWISLATAVVSMITALVGLLQKILEIRRRGDGR